MFSARITSLLLRNTPENPSNNQIPPQKYSAACTPRPNWKYPANCELGQPRTTAEPIPTSPQLYSETSLIPY